MGQASQPLLSFNFGAGQWERIRETLRCALYTVAVFSLFWTGLSFLAPNLYICIFMKPTREILEIAPDIIRRYSSSFLLLPLNIFSTYYFQALMQPKAAFIVSVFRGCVLSGIKNVTVIHGKGTGVLRKAVHEALRRNKSVRTFRLGVFGEGEAGVTIAELK